MLSRRVWLALFLLATALSSSSWADDSSSSSTAGLELRTKAYLSDRIASTCPGRIAAPSVATDVRALFLGDNERFEITFDGAATYHVRLNAAGEVIKCAPDPCKPLQRLAITMAQVDAINRQGLSWTAALTPEFHGRTKEEFGKGHKLRPPNTNDTAEAVHHRPLKASRALYTAAGNPAPPDAYDARDLLPGQIPCKAFTVLNQNACGSCYAFAAASAFSARMCRANPNSSIGNAVVSPEQLLDCSDGCGGGNAEDALGVLVRQGAVEQWCDPYTAGAAGVSKPCGTGVCSTGLRYTAQAVTSVGGAGVLGVQQMQYELLRNGPGSVAFMLQDDLYSYRSGVYTPSAGAVVDGGHAVALIGWGVDTNGVPYWLCQNSWGPSWGEGGFFRIVRGADTCTIESREGLVVATPVPPQAAAFCPPSAAPCADGAVTLADCTCRCDNGRTGPTCSECPAAGCPPPAGVSTPAMQARLNASQPIVDALRAAAPSATLTIVPGFNGALFLGGVFPLCYNIPWYLNVDPKYFYLYVGTGTAGAYYPTLFPQVPSAAQACVNLTLPANIANGTLTLSINTPVGDLGQLTFTAYKSSVGFASLSTSGNQATLVVSWTSDPGRLSLDDRVQLLDVNGNVLAWAYTNSNTQTRGASLSATTGTWRYTLTKSPGGFVPRLLPGGGPLPAAVRSQSIKWSSYGM